MICFSIFLLILVVNDILILLIFANASMALDVSYMIYIVVIFICWLMFRKIARQRFHSFILTIYLSSNRNSAKFAHNFYIENIIISKFIVKTKTLYTSNFILFNPNAFFFIIKLYIYLSHVFFIFHFIIIN